MFLKLAQSINRLLAPLGLHLSKWPAPQRESQLPHDAVLPRATYAPWLDDGDFKRVYTAIKPHTLVDVYRCHELWWLVAETAGLEGDILEVGVWRGGTGALMAAAAQASSPSTVFLCDTFSGVVKAGERDATYQGGEHSNTDRGMVQSLLASLGLANAEILVGVFPEDTGQAVSQRRFRLCHIDVDAYQSAKDVWDWVWPRLATGGVVVFDDYGFWQCNGVTELVNEQRGLAGGVVVHNLNGHGLVIKTAEGE